jgi:hypothetical protein
LLPVFAVGVGFLWIGVDSLAVPPAAPPQQAVAVVPGGVLWADVTRLRLVGLSRPPRLLATFPVHELEGPYLLSTSAQGMVLSSGARMWAGPLGGAVSPLPIPRMRGCWKAASPGFGGFFLSAADQVVLDPTWSCPNKTPMGPQPVFLRGVRGGHWRVLRLISSGAPPILAASGNLLVVGIQRSWRRMRVLLIDLRSGEMVGSFVTRDGYLTFADPERLVLIAPVRGRYASFPLEPQVNLGSGTYGGGTVTGSYGLSWYSTAGQLLGRLGRVSTLPMISNDQMITITTAQNGIETLSLRSLGRSSSRRLIAFRDPGRSFITAAFGWPRLAIVQTTSRPLPKGQFSCGYGPYAPPSSPILHVLDVSRPARFESAPTPPPQPDPATVLARCGPAAPAPPAPPAPATPLP